MSNILKPNPLMFCIFFFFIKENPRVHYFWCLMWGSDGSVNRESIPQSQNSRFQEEFEKKTDESHG